MGAWNEVGFGLARGGQGGLRVRREAEGEGSDECINMAVGWGRTWEEGAITGSEVNSCSTQAMQVQAMIASGDYLSLHPQPQRNMASSVDTKSQLPKFTQC
jgi:hypothetical protein